MLLLLLLPLMACGEDSTPAGSDPDPGPTGSPVTQPDFEVVEILSATAAGGEGGPAVRLDHPGGVKELTAGMRGSLPGDVRRIADGIRLREGQSLWGQVIAVGCDVPPSATVLVVDGQVDIVPGKVPSPKRECFAPVTSVAVAVVTGDLGTEH